jgi:EAL domain-containing protein (putative c-di-GMP-specific phosphodiesterase class I)
MGCDAAQGTFISPPGTATEIREKMRERNLSGRE